MPFKTPYDARKVGKKRWQLLAPLMYVDSDGGRYIVPTGFKTDLASIPRILYIILPPVGRYDEAAVQHDWMYYAGCPKEWADDQFLEAMKSCGVSLAKRRAMYRGVRMFGGFAYRKHRRNARKRNNM